MRSKKQLLKNLRLYAILDAPDKEVTSLAFYERVMSSGIDMAQIRFKDPLPVENYDIAEKIVKMGRRCGVSVIVNDRPELVLSLGADGVHLGKADMRVSTARTLLGEQAVIGRTVRVGDDISGLTAESPDYISAGPVYATPVKRHLSPCGVDGLKRLCSRTAIPVVAIGGINAGNINDVLGSGVRGAAFMGILKEGNDPRRVVNELKEKIGKYYDKDR
jgi:thiamine-phosphate pyrophosphorylase